MTKERRLVTMWKCFCSDRHTVRGIAPGAQVAELADALDSGSSGRKVVEVRVLSWAP